MEKSPLIIQIFLLVSAILIFAMSIYYGKQTINHARGKLKDKYFELDHRYFGIPSTLIAFFISIFFFHLFLLSAGLTTSKPKPPIMLFFTDQEIMYLLLFLILNLLLFLLLKFLYKKITDRIYLVHFSFVTILAVTIIVSLFTDNDSTEYYIGLQYTGLIAAYIISLITNKIIDARAANQASENDDSSVPSPKWGEFKKQKKMCFMKANKSENMPAFWGGVDNLSGYKYELFFTAKKSGPTSKQLQIYEDFVKNYSNIEPQIISGCQNIFPSDKSEKFQNTPIELHFLSVMAEDEPYEIEMIWVAYKSPVSLVDFIVRTRYNEIISLELNQ